MVRGRRAEPALSARPVPPPAPATSRVRIEPERLARDLRGLSRIGLNEDGSVTRVAFSVAELRARHYLIHLIQEAGLAVRVDGIGNVIGRLPGAGAGPAVALGSHLDSVPQGGRFDGAVGVVAALEVVRAIHEAGLRTRRPLEVLVFAAEESSRFGFSTIGSSAMAGAADPDRLLALTDRNGERLGDILSHLGVTRDDLAAVRRPPGAVGHYLELHIEQGRVLAEAGKRLGVVQAIPAPCRLKVVYRGRADHSGATPMHLRRDALVAAARLIAHVEDVCAAPRAVPVVGTVGVIDAKPGAMNVIPGEATLWIDLRSTSLAERTACRDAVVGEARRLAEARGLALEVATLMEETPVPMAPEVVTLLARIAAARGIDHLVMDSGAGHDAMQIAQIARAGMLFVPSREGISHNLREWTSTEDVVLGATVLLDATLRLADGDA